ncbi:MAG: acetyltransferase [Candidatus Egerieousia sp.]
MNWNKTDNRYIIGKDFTSGSSGPVKIAVFGAGGFGREVMAMIEELTRTTGRLEIAGFFDDGVTPGILVNGYKTLGGMDAINSYPEDLGLVIAVGSPGVKKKIISKITNDKIFFPTVIAKSAIVSDPTHVTFGKGCIVCDGTIITTNSNIGDFVTLNLGCTVGHDTNISSYSSFMPSVNISGEVNIGESVYVGTGAKIINQLEIGMETTVGAGAVVAKSLPAGCTAVGVPAKPIKF